MPRLQIEDPQNDHRSTALVLLCGLAALAIVGFVLVFGSLHEWRLAGLNPASSTLNQFTAILLTCIALIVPLTSNLYSPRLVKLYVTHPMIVAGLAILVLSHLLTLAVNALPKGHALEKPLAAAISVCFLIVMAGTLPFLYAVSQFLRPAYFVPELARKGVRDIHALGQGASGSYRRTKGLFETIDVVANIALTGMHRGDRQLVLQALGALHQLLAEFVVDGATGSPAWRSKRPCFVPGIAREGQEYLVRNQVWPEAYVLAQMLRVMEMTTSGQHEMLAELASQLVETAQLASLCGRKTVTELHVMTFNSLMREAVEDKDLRQFQNLSYHYRLLIEALHEDPEQMHDAAQHLLHYGNLSAQQGLHFGLETVIYDMGEMVLSLGSHHEDRAVELFQTWAGPLWQDAIAPNSAMQKAGWRVIVKVYWEAKARHLERLAESLFWRFLSDETIHREHVELILDENRELHYEFNDRLMRFAHLSPEAEGLARQFTEDY